VAKRILDCMEGLSLENRIGRTYEDERISKNRVRGRTPEEREAKQILSSKILVTGKIVGAKKRG